jgi:hypothetical protein
MRLAARTKLGFFPAPEQAVAHLATLLVPPRVPWSLLDPCAGRGAAAGQLAEILRCPPSQVFVIELDEDRDRECHEVFPEGKVLAPCSFFGAHISLNSVSLALVNAPFDAAYEHERVELQFLRRATEILMPGGVVAFVCPEKQADEYTDVREIFKEWYTEVQTVPFPPEARPFNEVVVFGVKRKQPVSRYTVKWQEIQAPPGHQYHIPPGSGPKTFKKSDPTEHELRAALAASPLRVRMQAPLAGKLGRPPLPVSKGHTVLLLAAGNLDGVVQPEGKPPHVVRGTSRKRDFLQNCTTTENEDGTETTRKVFSQKISLVVRTLGLDGVIRTFNDAAEEDEQAPQDESEEES